MAGIPETFTKLSPVIANYDFVDIASGTGYINFYAGNSNTDELLSNFTYYSDAVSFSASKSGDVNFTAVIDKDFDTLLNRPLTIKGLSIINIPASVIRTGGATSQSIYCKVIVRKWDGATETDIVTSSNGRQIDAGATMVYGMSCISVDIPQTHFKIGETLRLTVQVYLSNGGASSGTAYLGNDPKNRSTGWDTTGAVPSQLLFQCPVRLSI